jgi:hypothetical protein
MMYGNPLTRLVRSDGVRCSRPGYGRPESGQERIVTQTGCDRVKELHREEAAPFRIPVDGRVELRRGLNVLALAQSQSSREASFARI